jgi:DNA-binding CsgD family transcriptional regulator
MEIARLVTLGHTNRRIADELRISVWTVSAHLRRIFSKLGVSTRTAMVWALSDELTGRRDRNGD